MPRFVKRYWGNFLSFRQKRRSFFGMFTKSLQYTASPACAREDSRCECMEARRRLYIYKDGVFYDLRTAYEKGESIDSDVEELFTAY